MGAEASRQGRQDAAHAAVPVLPLSPREALPSLLTHLQRAAKQYWGKRTLVFVPRKKDPPKITRVTQRGVVVVFRG